MQAELALKADALLGEGALWHAPTARLWWVDIDGCAAHAFDPATGTNRTVATPEHCTTIVPMPDGNAMAAVGRGLARLDFATGTVEPFGDLSPEPEGNRLNDGKCDPVGRLWVGGLAFDGTAGASALYRVNQHGEWTQMLPGVTCSNGLAWSVDGGSFYYIDTPTRCVEAFDFDLNSGTIANRRTVVEIPREEGFPDGMTIDCEGLLWVALWSGAGVVRIDPEQGKIVGKVHVPASLVTSCAFGGPDLDRLYITTARHLPPEQLAKEPDAGSLFCVDAGVRGIPANTFGEA